MTALGSHLGPDGAVISRLRRVASGAEPGDLVIRGGRILALHTREILARDVVVADGRIAAVTPHGRLEGLRELDADRRFVAPGFIDAHLHIEYTAATPGQLARVSVPRGTTTVLADPGGLGVIAGRRGVELMGRTTTPLRIFQQITSQIPGSPLQPGPGALSQADHLDLLGRSTSATMGESSPYQLSDDAAERYARAITEGRRINGHTARLSDEGLWQYLAAGVGDDHNAATVDDVIERIRLGGVINVQATSMNDNLPITFADPDRVAEFYDRFTFCADDRYTADIADEGHIDHHIRSAIALGVPVLDAYRMATLNTALHYRLDHLIGSVTPTRLADLVLVSSLDDAVAETVLVGGDVVAEDGSALFDASGDDHFGDLVDTVHISPDIGPWSFRVPVAGSGAWVQAMEMYEGYWKRAFHVELAAEDGNLVADVTRDILKVAVVDRHFASNDVGIGFVRGFGLTRGAIAASTSCSNHAIVTVGASDRDLAVAVRTLGEIGGGWVVVDDGEVIATVPLPVGGMMSDDPVEINNARQREAQEAVRGLGSSLGSPFMILSFIGLPGVPDLGISEKGLIHTPTQRVIDLVLDVGGDGVACHCSSHDQPIHALADPATARGTVG